MRQRPLPEVLVVCTANVCRSRMSEAIMASALSGRAIVESAGTWPNELTAPKHQRTVMAARGYRVDDRPPRLVSKELITASSLIITMERQHIRHVTALDQTAFARTFTLRELVRRACSVGPRRPDQSLEQWLGVVNGDRTPSVMVSGTYGGSKRGSLDDPDEIPDPYGRSRSAFERCFIEISDLTSRLVDLGWPERSPH